MTSDGWNESAEAWIGHLGAHGDDGRRYILDPAMHPRLEGRGFKRALDVGCGEGRVCRWLSNIGVDAIGIDPTERLIEEARRRGPGGDYRIASAEALPFEDASFDLVVTCLSLIDIPDFRAAIREMTRVLEPGGTLMAANLTSYNSAADGRGWKRGGMGAYKHFAFDHYLEERANDVSWAGIHIKNWHRPLSAYMQAYLGEGLRLTFFDEPAAIGAPDAYTERQARAPWFNLMEWTKPA